MSYFPDFLKRRSPSPGTLQGGSEEPLIIDFPSYFFCLLQWISYLQHIACYGLHKHTYGACKNGVRVDLHNLEMCVRAEADGMLRDGRPRVADALISSSHLHLPYQEKRANRFPADVSDESAFALTQRELWRVVIDIGEGDFDLCCPRQSSHVTAHVFGLDHHVVFLASLTVHVWQGGTDYTWMGRHFCCRLNLGIHLLYMPTYILLRCTLLHLHVA